MCLEIILGNFLHLARSEGDIMQSIGNDYSESSAGGVAPQVSPLDSSQLGDFSEQTGTKQNLPMAIIFGAVAAAISAGVWAGITVATGYQIGWIAVGVGFLVGLTVKFFGKGTSPVFGMIGAIYAFLGCFVGNFLSVCIIGAEHEGIKLMEVFNMMTLPMAIELMKSTFNPMDLLFYAIAIYEGFKFSFSMEA